MPYELDDQNGYAPGVTVRTLNDLRRAMKAARSLPISGTVSRWRGAIAVIAAFEAAGGNGWVIGAGQRHFDQFATAADHTALRRVTVPWLD